MFSFIRVAMVFTDKEMDLKGKQPGQHLDLDSSIQICGKSNFCCLSAQVYSRLLGTTWYTSLEQFGFFKKLYSLQPVELWSRSGKQASLKKKRCGKDSGRVRAKYMDILECQIRRGGKSCHSVCCMYKYMWVLGFHNIQLEIMSLVNKGGTRDSGEKINHVSSSQSALESRPTPNALSFTEGKHLWLVICHADSMQVTQLLTLRAWIFLGTKDQITSWSNVLYYNLVP